MNSQGHEVEETTSGQNNQGKQSEDDDKKLKRNKPEPIKNTTQAETPKKKKLEQITQPIQRMHAQETSWTEKGSVPNTKTKKNISKKQQKTLTPQNVSKNMKQKHVLWMKEIHQRKKNYDFVKGHFAEVPRKATKRHTCFPLVSFSNARAGPGEKKSTR